MPDVDAHDSPAPPDPVARTLWALIGINVAVFVAWQTVGQAGVAFMADHFLVSVDSVLSLRFWTLLTSEFSHLDANHLILNMLGLWVFGRPVAMALGPRALVHLYVAGALLASVGHVVFGLITESANPALGASGAVMAISVVFAALFPNARLLIMFVVPMRAWMAVLLYIGLDLFGVLGGGVVDGAYPGARAGIAHAAHLGGALYGLSYYALRVRPRLRRR